MLFSHFYQQEGRFPISQSHNIAQLFLFYSTLLNTIGHDLKKSLIVLALCIQVFPTRKTLSLCCRGWDRDADSATFLPTPSSPTHPVCSFPYPRNSYFHSQRWVSAKGTHCWGFINISWSSVSCKHIFLAQHQPHGTCRSLPLEGWVAISIALRAHLHKTQRITLNTSSP